MIKKKGRMVRLNLPPLTLRDAWDVGAFKLDHQLQRTGRLIPVGINDVVAKLPKSVAGYYGKNDRKFRRVRIKKGKVLSLERTIIEKKKYIGDTASELRALKSARKRVSSNVRKKSMRISTKKQPTLNQLKDRKRALISKRRIMLNKLKRR